MHHRPSLPHLAIVAGLVVLAAWLGLASGNALGAAYSLIAAIVVLSSAFEPSVEPAPVRVEVEP